MSKNILLSIAYHCFCVGLLVGLSNAESCVSCSSKTDENCAQKPELYMSKMCANQANNIRCYTRIVDGNTLRGCTDEMDEGVQEKCKTDENCEICSNLNNNVGCNNQLFPRHRITCHICSGSLNSSCSTAIETIALACPQFKEGDQCFIRKTGDTIERGCASDTGTKCSNQNQCFICNGHGCNFLDVNSADIPLAQSSAPIWKSTFNWSIVILFSHCVYKVLQN